LSNTIVQPVRKGRAKVPVVMQLEALECGAACLAMILAYYQKWIPLEQVRLDCGVSRDGSNAKNILYAARNYGLDANGYRFEPESLRENGIFPCIVHWNFNHFVVCCGFQGNYVYLNDPARGNIRVTMEEFDESFTGIALLMEPSETFEPGGKRTLVPARDRNFASHEVWDDDGKGFSWCGRPGDYVYHHDLATGRQERWCGIAGARHNNVSPDNRYVVCDEAPEAWWRGCKWRVAFWNRETERGVWIYTTRPALMPREKPSRLHPDPHPHFVMNGRYVVSTANNADGHMDLYVTPVDQLVKMTTP